MNVGLSMLFCLGEPFSSMLKRLDEVDVDCVEVVDESEHALDSKRVQALRKIGRDNGLEYTVHAPFVDINIASLNPELRQVMLKRLEKSMRHTRQLKGQMWVFHSGWKTGISEFYPEADWQMNLRSIRTLQATARKLKVEISVENTPQPFPFLLKTMQDFALFYSELSGDLGLTLDIAHAHTCNQALDFIEKFKDRIVHAHVSDNDGKYDAHRGIGRGNIDWQAIEKAFTRNKFKGYLMIESTEHVEESLQKMRQIFMQ